MTEQEYIQNRLEEQIQWYNKKSTWNQRWYMVFHIIQIIAAALIPFLTGFIDSSLMQSATLLLKIIVGSLGVVVAVASGILGMYKFHELWITYRGTSEALRQEKFLFQTRTDPYDIEQPFPLLVERIEALLSGENQQWNLVMKKSMKGRQA